MQHLRSATIVFTAILLSVCIGRTGHADEWNLDSAFGVLEHYTGGEHEALDYLNDRVRAAQNTFTLKRDLESRFLALIQRPGISPAARDFALSQLYRVATEQSVHVLAPLLYKPDTTELARVALEKVPANEATDVLVEAMRKTSGSMRAGIIYSLGERGDERAAKAITKFSGRGDSDVVRAAIWALGEIGGPVAVKDLKWCRGNTLRQHREFAGLALLNAADKYMEAGNVDEALEIYDTMFIRTESVDMRARALHGILEAEGPDAIDTIIDVLRTEEPPIQQAALHALRHLPGESVTVRAAEALPTLPDKNQVQVMRALAERGDRTALPAMHDMLRSTDTPVRHAAIAALGKLGDNTSVDALIALMLRPGTPDIEPIRAALTEMDGPGVDDALVAEVLGPNNRVKTEIINILVARGTPHAGRALIRVAERETAAIQLQALEGLGQLASTEAIPMLVDFMASAPSAEARAAARQATIATLQRSGHGPNGTQALVAALSRNDVPADVKRDVIEFMQIDADDAALPALAEVAKRDKGELGLASLRALGSWPTNAALDAMNGLARAMKRDPQRGAWVDGYLNLLSRAGAEASIEHFEAVAKAVETSGEKQRLLEILEDSGHPEAPTIAEDFLDDPHVGPAAAAIIGPPSN